MDKSGGKLNVFLRKITPYVNLIQPFGIVISSEALMES